MELFSNWNNIPEKDRGILKQKLFTGKDVMFVRNEVKPHAVMPAHRHIHEQILYVASGACDIVTDGKACHLEAGGLALFPSNAEHKVTNTEAVPLITLEIFTPIREDFL